MALFPPLPTAGQIGQPIAFRILRNTTLIFGPLIQRTPCEAARTGASVARVVMRGALTSPTKMSVDLT